MTTSESVAKFVRDHPKAADEIAIHGRGDPNGVGYQWWKANGLPTWMNNWTDAQKAIKSHLAATQQPAKPSAEEAGLAWTQPSGGKDPQDTSASDGPSGNNQPQNTENMANTTVELRAFYGDEDLSNARPSRIIQVIKSIKDEIKTLEDLGESSTFVTKQVAEKKEAIAGLLEVLDSKA